MLAFLALPFFSGIEHLLMLRFNEDSVLNMILIKAPGGEAAGRLRPVFLEGVSLTKYQD